MMLQNSLHKLLEELKDRKRTLLRAMGIDYEEKAFYDILKAVAKKYEFEYPGRQDARAFQANQDHRGRQSSHTRIGLPVYDIKATLQVDLILLLG